MRLTLPSGVAQCAFMAACSLAVVLAAGCSSSPHASGTATVAAQPQVRIVNGIRIGPGAPGSIECRAGEPVDADPRWLVGTPLEITAWYLPAGSVLVAQHATECHSVNNAAGALYEVRDSSGGVVATLTIGRSVGTLSVPTSLPLDRSRPITVAGRPAALVPGGVGDGRSMLIVAEDWGVTVLTGQGIDETELLRVAEGLYWESSLSPSAQTGTSSRGRRWRSPRPGRPAGSAAATRMGSLRSQRLAASACRWPE